MHRGRAVNPTGCRCWEGSSMGGDLWEVATTFVEIGREIGGRGWT
jgi:hypothetical protein